MSLPEKTLLEFYRECDYWPSKGKPYRPSELYIPLLLSELKANDIEKICKTVLDGSIKIPLTASDCVNLAPTLMHESLFHFSKSLPARSW